LAMGKMYACLHTLGIEECVMVCVMMRYKNS
jgi:hypothetical protein